MWRCHNCGRENFQPVWTRENIGFPEQPYWEDEAHCPFCDSGSVDDAEANHKIWIDHLVYAEKCRLLSGNPSEKSVAVTERWEAKEPPRDEYLKHTKWYTKYKMYFVEVLAGLYDLEEGGNPYNTKPGKFSVSIEYMDICQIHRFIFCNLSYDTFKKVFTDMNEAGFYPTAYFGKQNGYALVRTNCSLGSLRMTDFNGYVETDEALEKELADLGFDEAEFRKEKEAEYDS